MQISFVSMMHRHLYDIYIDQLIIKSMFVICGLTEDFLPVLKKIKYGHENSYFFNFYFRF